MKTSIGCGQMGSYFPSLMRNYTHRGGTAEVFETARSRQDTDANLVEYSSAEVTSREQAAQQGRGQALT